MNVPSHLRADPISVLLPDVRDPAELELRRELLDARNALHATLARSDPYSWSARLALIGVEVAGRYAFAPAGRETLNEALDTSRRLMVAIVAAQILEAPRGPQ